MCIDRRRQRGLTLIELIIFIIVISMGLAGILSVMNVTVRSSADPVVRKQSLAMAEAILEEVLTKDFANPSGGYAETDTTNCSNRALYDDVDDYACFDGAPATAVIKGTDTLGAGAIAGLAGLSATVSVAATAVSTIAMKRVTVTVTGGPDTIVLSGHRAGY
ncbi:MAG: prepilin-type N-terminal cleavage/methylation domain-containing protein [Candidatus Nitricoxidivorans perseverans]|uniref:Prepilin-type N-terminal cleavage/methylation domain-containing protein n=1 Tax=Candidatus Nitricoxidivorans perseverans TaxID=2975601 RepID=A0AA49FK60_9PROT|nr:MAG: prepilin-type N-terminal cleavage/methylation domain-containing protein [Candidatus Nitricoxidivorans perseverans]